MTLTQLEHVLQAHRARSFSKAARACGVSQAALSNSIAKLEEELGERIFSRTTRQVSLSPFGETLLGHIEQILHGRDALLGVVKAQHEPAVTVIGHSPIIPPQIVNQLVSAIRAAHEPTPASAVGAVSAVRAARGAPMAARPPSEIRLIEENLSDLLQRLGEHTVDIAILPQAEYASAFRSVAVGEDPLVLVPRRSSKRAARPVSLAELAEEQMVMVPDRCGLARTTRALFAEAGVPLRAYGGEAMGYHVLREWAALDLGSAILPRSRVPEGVHALPLLRASGEPAVLTYRVVWHSEYARGKQLARALQAFRPGGPGWRVAPPGAGGDEGVAAVAASGAVAPVGSVSPVGPGGPAAPARRTPARRRRAPAADRGRSRAGRSA